MTSRDLNPGDVFVWSHGWSDVVSEVLPKEGTKCAAVAWNDNTWSSFDTVDSHLENGATVTRGGVRIWPKEGESG